MPWDAVDSGPRSKALIHSQSRPVTTHFLYIVDLKATMGFAWWWARRRGVYIIIRVGASRLVGLLWRLGCCLVLQLDASLLRGEVTLGVVASLRRAIGRSRLAAV